MVPTVATRSDPGSETQASHAAAAGQRRRTQEELDAELRQAIEDIERGDFIELTPEQLARCVATGESPWPDAFQG